MEDLYEYVVSMRDTDATGFVFHPRYLEIFTVARESFAFNNRIDFTTLTKDFGLHFAVYDLKIRFFRSASIGEVLRIETKIAKINESRVVLNQDMFLNERPLKLIAKQEITLVGVGLIDNKIKRLPKFSEIY